MKQSASCEANSSSFSKQFPFPYGNKKRIINEFGGVRHWYPFWAGLIYYIPSHIVYLPHIITPSYSHPRLEVGSGKEWTSPPHPSAQQLLAICVSLCISTSFGRGNACTTYVGWGKAGNLNTHSYELTHSTLERSLPISCFNTHFIHV